MKHIIASRRDVLIAMAAASALSGRADAQNDNAAQQWVLQSAGAWREILQVPMGLASSSTLSSYDAIKDAGELAQARAAASARRARFDSGIAHCRDLVEHVPAPPNVGGPRDQAIVDQVASDQRRALERLSALGAFLEANSNDLAGGAAPFQAAMRLALWATFREIDFILAASAKVGRLGQQPDSFLDIWPRVTTLDWLTSSLMYGAFVTIVHGDPSTDLAAAQLGLRSASAEMRLLAPAFSERCLVGLAPAPRARMRETCRVCVSSQTIRPVL